MRAGGRHCCLPTHPEHTHLSVPASPMSERAGEGYLSAGSREEGDGDISGPPPPPAGAGTRVADGRVPPLALCLVWWMGGGDGVVVVVWWHSFLSNTPWEL